MEENPAVNAVAQEVPTPQSDNRLKSFFAQNRKRLMLLGLLLFISIPVGFLLINKPSAPTPGTTPTPPTPKSVYLEKAEQTMAPGLKTLLTSSYAPSSLTVSQITQKNGKVLDEKLLVGS